MRILIQSRAFPPSVGGLETVMEMLAEGFVREGHEVKVVTATSEVGSKPLPFDVVRNPGPRGFLSVSHRGSGDLAAVEARSARKWAMMSGFTILLGLGPVDDFAAHVYLLQLRWKHRASIACNALAIGCPLMENEGR